MILGVLSGLSIGSLGPAKRVDREAKSARGPSLGSACAWMVFVAEEIACWMDGERWTDCGTMFLSHSLVPLPGLPTKHQLAELAEEIEGALLGEEVSALVACIDATDLDNLVLNPAPEVMVFNIDMACAWPHLGRCRKLEGA